MHMTSDTLDVFFREVSPRLFSDSDTLDTILLWQLFAFGRFVLVKQLVKGSTTRFADVGIQMLKFTVKLWTGHGLPATTERPATVYTG